MKFDKLFESLMQDTIRVGMYAGSFTPPHYGHFQAAEQMVNDGNDYMMILASAKDRQGSNGAVSESIWKDIYIPLLDKSIILQFSPLSPVKDMADLILLSKQQPVNNVSPLIEKLSKRIAGKNVEFNIYAGEDRMDSYEKSFKKYEDENTSVEIHMTGRPNVDLGNRTFNIVDKGGNTEKIFGIVPMSGTLLRNLVKELDYNDPLLKELFPPRAFDNPRFKNYLQQLK